MNVPSASVGFQTIVFGRRVSEVRLMLEAIAAAGFEGVEFFQNPKRLLHNQEPVSVDDLKNILDEFQLRFLGLAGGSISQRVDFCRSAKGGGYIRPDYLYSDNPDDENLRSALDQGFNIAIHPHAYRQVERTSEALQHQLLQQKPHAENGSRVFLMPDTGHMSVMGEPVVQSLLAIPPHLLHCMHLKDWDPGYGRAYNMYAEGFTLLGEGEVEPSQILTELRLGRLPKWIVVEQDFSEAAVSQCLLHSKDWIERHGLGRHPQANIRPLADLEPELDQAFGRLPDTTVFDSLCDKKSGIEGKPYLTYPEFIRGIYEAEVLKWPECYKRMSDLACKLFHAKHVSLWSFGHQESHEDYQDLVLLHTIDGEAVTKSKTSLNREEAGERLAETLQSLDTDLFNIQDECSSRGVSHVGSYWRQIAAKAGGSHILLVPVPQKYNPHQLRFLLVAVLDDEAAQSLRPHPTEEIIDCLVDPIADAFSHSASVALRKRIDYLESHVALIGTRMRTLEQFLADLRKLLLKYMPCEGASIFLERYDGETMELRTKGSAVWASDLNAQQRLVRRESDDLIARCWHGRLPIIDQKAGRSRMRSEDLLEGEGLDTDRFHLIAVPLHTRRYTKSKRQADRVVGVVRCRNKYDDQGNSLLWTNDDAAILTAICNSALPQIELYLGYEVQGLDAAVATHEMRNPIAGLKSHILTLGRMASVATAFYTEKFEESIKSDPTLIGRVRAEATSLAARLHIDVRAAQEYTEEGLKLLSTRPAFVRIPQEGNDEAARSRVPVHYSASPGQLVSDAWKNGLAYVELLSLAVANRQFATGRTPAFNFKVCDIRSDVIADVRDQVRPFLSSPGELHAITYTGRQRSPERAEGQRRQENWKLAMDLNRMQQVFFNLFLNAIKYRSKERPFKINVELEDSGNSIVVRVGDNGRGIDKKDAENIFDFGYQCNDSDVVANEILGSGMGIGLWVVRKVIEGHGGQIKLSEKSDYVTEFYIWLPKTQMPEGARA